MIKKNDKCIERERREDEREREREEREYDTSTYTSRFKKITAVCYAILKKLSISVYMCTVDPNFSLLYLLVYFLTYTTCVRTLHIYLRTFLYMCTHLRYKYLGTVINYSTKVHSYFIQ